MAHNVESMAYVGETPWHGLGTIVPDGINPQDLMVKAGLAWDAQLTPCYIRVNGELVETGRYASVRSTDGRILSPAVSKNWKPVQNQQAFDFFMEFCAGGDMKMDTAGSLKNGQYVWALARIQESFSLFKGKDVVNGYLLFSNPHIAGRAITVMFTPVRVVCNNTLTMALEGEATAGGRFRHLHTAKFDPEEAKLALGLAKGQLSAFKETAKFLSSKKMTEQQAIEYFQQLFPANEREASLLSERVGEVLESQPGANLGAGTWWQGFNAVTYFLDHKIGRGQDTRLASAWYGWGRNKKDEALQTAVKLANAA